jgi:hypothetical protein
MDFPYLTPTRKFEQMLDTFLGYNQNGRINEGEWADMQNISPRAFPCFAPREQRGAVKQLTAPSAMIARDALVWVDGATLYINDYPVSGLTLSVSAGMTPKTLVSMGAYVVILPDKKYVNTANLTDYGSIESTYTYTGDVDYAPARADGTNLDLTGVPATVEPPADPANGDYWIYIGGETHVQRQYSSMSEEWVDIPSVYTSITLPGVGTYFSQYDGVSIEGCAFVGTDEGMTAQLSALNGSKIIMGITDNAIIVTGLLNQVYTQEDATVTIKRSMPDMDFVIESENRLWGCKYGLVNGKTVNEIYACAQGDFKNWNKFMGTAMDSYAASVGTDGKFTGAITYLGYPTFFKEMNMHRVYGSMPSQYRIDTNACRGVQDGSGKSLAIVNEVLYYKGRTDVLCYDGSLPFSVSDALGGLTYRDAVGGAYKDRYYLSMKQGNEWFLFFFDTAKKLWFKEDKTHALCFAQTDDELYYIDADAKKVMACFGKAGTKESPVSFYAQSGIIGYSTKDKKYISRLNIRAKLESGSELRVYLRHDSAVDWVLAGAAKSVTKVYTTLLPIRPKRCDHFEMKLEGTGDLKVFSIASIREQGADA